MKQLLPTKIGKTFIALIALVIVAAVSASLGADGTHIPTSVAFLGLFGSTKRLKKSVPKKMIDIDLEFISILTDDQRPANGLPVLVKSVDGQTDKREVRTHVVHKDVAQGLLYATTYEPGKVDAQNDTTDSAEIQKMAHKLALNGRFANLDVNHNLKKSGSHIVETFILRGEDPMFPNIAKGAHCIVVQLSDELKAKAADITGVSIYGTCKQVEKSEDATIQKGNSEWLRDLRSAEGLEIGDTQMAKALGLALADYTQLESGEADFEWTPEAIDAVAKLTKQKPSVIAASALNGKAPAPAEAPAEETPVEMSEEAPAEKSVTQTPPTKQTIEMEKKTLRSKAGSLTVTDGAGSREIQKSITERRSELFKAMREQVYAVRKDVFEEGMLDEGGTVKPHLGQTILDASIEASDFLKNIQVVEMSSLSEDVAVFAIAGRKARRFDSRDEVADAALTETDNMSITMTALDADIAYNIPDRVLNNYRNRFPQFEKVMGDSMLNTFVNDLVDLGFNGTTDTYANTFLTLNEGWLTKAQAAGNAWQIVDASTEGFTIITDSFDLAIANMAANQPKYAKKDTAFVISAVDFENLELELLGMPGGFQVAVEGAKGSYRGHPVFVENSLPEGYFLYTQMKNFVVGIVTQGSNGVRSKILEKTKSRDFILSAAVDFAFVDDEGYVVGKP